MRNMLYALPQTNSSLPSFIVISHHEISSNLELFRTTYLKTEPHGKFAVCNLCQAPLNYQNSTSSLQYHVKSKHKDKLKDLPIQKAQKHRLEDDDSAIVRQEVNSAPPKKEG